MSEPNYSADDYALDHDLLFIDTEARLTMSDAAFREALDAWEYEVGMRATGRVDLEMYHKARDRVLALYAERQGEVYEVRGRITGPDGMTLELWTDDAGLPWLGLGTRVRLVPVEEP